MMKNIKYIILAVSALIMASCGDDDYSIEYVDTEVKTDLVGTVTVDYPEAVFDSPAAYDGALLELSYTLPQSFDVESTLQVTLKSSFSALEINPNIELLHITVPAGTSSGTESFEMPNYGNEAPFSGISGFLSVSLTGIALTQPEEGSVDDPFRLSSNPFSVDLFQTNFASPLYHAAVFNVMMMSLDWEGPYGGGENDLDLYVFDAAFTTLYESSESGSRFEGDFFNNPANENFPDGDYIMEVATWTTVSADPVPYRLLITRHDGTQEVLSGSVDPAIGWVDYLVTQTTDGAGERTYVISGPL